MTANFLRAAARLGRRVDVELVEEADRRADLMEQAVERGKRAEGIAVGIITLPWTGSGREALEIFPQAKEADFRAFPCWFKLGLALYDGRFYEEALEAFRRTSQLADQAPYKFAGLVWHWGPTGRPRSRLAECVTTSTASP